MMPVRRFPCRWTALALAGVALTGAPGIVSAQDRLLSTGAAGLGATLETVRFGGAGLVQTTPVGGDTIRLRRVQQAAIPVTIAIPLGTVWTVDLQSAWASSQLTYADAGGVERTATLSGPTDVRLRATGRLFNDAVVLTAGVNAPTGKTELTAGELTALRVAAAPALGLGAPPVGAGPSGTMGMVLAREIAGWAVAVGASYELRGTYQPIAAITAGAPSTDFRPGNVVRGSVGLDRLLGAHRLSLTGAVDVYANDELRVPQTVNPLATIRLGPVISTDVQLQLAAPRVKELALWGTSRYRARYERDGRAVAGTSGLYVDGGLRTSFPLSAATDLLITADGRWHSGLAINQGVATARVVAGGGTLGLTHRLGVLSLQPYMRAQAGTLRSRAAGNTPATSIAGGSAGLIILARF